MALILDEEQQLLKDSPKPLSENFPSAHCGQCGTPARSHARSLVTDERYGLTGMVVPDAYSGLEFGYVGAGVVLEEMGRTLALSPFELSSGCDHADQQAGQ